MKITRLKLVNFIGIKHGTGLDEIEIAFGDRKIVMLNGGNGSGKSTIMSQLHPYKDSFDDRKKLVTDGTEGVKEIDIEHDGAKYEIVHHYGKAAKSFVKKDGVEMNENGGVKTFEAYIEAEFGVTTDYFKIGKIGSNTQSFIDQTTAERKTYIAKFLPAIEDYQEKFDIVKEKFRASQADIKAVSADLDKLEQVEALKAKIDSLESLIASFDSDIERYSGEAAVLASDTQRLNSELAKVDMSQVSLEIIQKEDKKKNIEQFARVFMTKYGYAKMNTEDLDKMVSDLAPKLAELSKGIAVLESQAKSFAEQIAQAENDARKAEYKLSEVKNAEDPAEIAKKLSSAEKKLKELKETMKDPLSLTVSKNQRDVSVQLSKFESFMNFIIKYHKDLNSSALMQTLRNIESFMDEDFGRTLEGQIVSMRTLIQSKQSALASAKATLASKDAELIKLDKIYKGIAGEEKVEICGTCPFVKNAADYSRLPKEIAQLRQDIVQMDKDLAEFALKAENISELKSLYQTFTSSYEQMGPRTNQVYIYFAGNHGKLMEVVSGSINDLTKAVNDLVSRVNAILYSLQETTKLESEIENLRFKKSISENNEKLRRDAEESLAEKKSRLDALRKSLEDNSRELAKKRKDFSQDESFFNDHREHLEGRKERASLATQISALMTTRDEHMARKADLADKTKNLAEVNARLADSRKRRSDTGIEVVRSKSSLSSVENLIARKANLERDYEGLRLLKDALDPNKGVPLYFIKSYLEKTRDIANELLDLAFGGDFEINFYTNEKEFFIQVRAGENVKNDIKEASQGEVALTTISISLALIEQAIGKYNVLCLDEIDGPLDQVNRSKFIDIITKQVGKLGIEQVFVISHNDAFDTEEMDLVILRGSNVNQKGDEFMRNKSVIFELKE